MEAKRSEAEPPGKSARALPTSGCRTKYQKSRRDEIVGEEKYKGICAEDTHVEYSVTDKDRLAAEIAYVVWCVAWKVHDRTFEVSDREFLVVFPESVEGTVQICRIVDPIDRREPLLDYRDSLPDPHRYILTQTMLDVLRGAQMVGMCVSLEQTDYVEAVLLDKCEEGVGSARAHSGAGGLVVEDRIDYRRLGRRGVRNYVLPCRRRFLEEGENVGIGANVTLGRAAGHSRLGSNRKAGEHSTRTDRLTEHIGKRRAEGSWTNFREEEGHVWKRSRPWSCQTSRYANTPSRVTLSLCMMYIARSNLVDAGRGRTADVCRSVTVCHGL
jgi:hypothetical protein